MYAAGIKNIDLYFIITEVAGPVILFLSLSVVLPYMLAEALNTIPGKLLSFPDDHLHCAIQVYHFQCSTSLYELFIHRLH